MGDRGRLQGKTAVVTGAGSTSSDPELVGNGQAMALLLAREGAQVVVVDVDLERAERTRAEIEADGGTAFVARADVTDSEQCRRALEEARNRYGRVDVLVNNVGIADDIADITKFDETQWERVISVNVTSALRMCQHAIPLMMESGGGSVINVSSAASIQAAGHFLYGPSKAALNMLTRELAVRYGRRGIRVNAVAPGHLWTPMIAPYFSPEVREMRRKVAPLGVEGNAWDVAWAVVYLASDEARFVTGICLPIDGGRTQTGGLTVHRLLNEPD